MESETEDKIIKLKNDGEISLSEGRSKSEIHWKNKSMKYSELIQRLRNPIKTTETFLEYKSMSKDKRDRIKDVGGYIGGLLKESRRKAENVQNRTFITLDVDFARNDIWTSIETQYNFAVCLCSTHTHEPAAPRLRLIIPLSRPVLPDEYQAISRMIASDIGIEQFDTTTFQPYRLMYWPSTSIDGEYLFKVQDKEWLNPDRVLKRYTYGWQDTSYWPESSKATKKLTNDIKHQEDPLKKKFVVGAFCRAYSIIEAIDEFLSDVYVPTNDTNRYTYDEGSTTSGVVIYDDKWSYSHHATDPASCRLCNSFDLVRIQKFGDLDNNAKESTPINKMPSFIEMKKFAVEDKKVKLQLGEDLETETQADFEPIETGVIADTSWKKDLSYSNNGIPLNTVKNFRIIIENDSLLKGRIKLDEFSYRYTVLGKLPWNKEDKKRDFSDTDDCGLREFLETRYKISSNTKYTDAITLAVQDNSFHPVKDYFESLKWDGTKRLDTLLIDYYACADTIYNRFVMKKWLVAAVTRIYNPGAKFDHVIVLIGEPGLGKSTFFNKLAGDEWFTDSLKKMDDKIVMETMAGKLIAEFGELEGMRKAEVEAVKTFITKREFNARLVWEKRATRKLVQWVYAGTTNKPDFLKDLTGNRRFWPVEVFKSNNKNVFVDLDKERDQIWAEAIQQYKDGEKIFLTSEEELLAKGQQELHMEVDEIQQILDDCLNWNAPQEQWHECKHTDIVEILNLDSRQKRYAKQNLKAILLKKGIKQRRKNSGVFYRILPMLSDSISDFQSIF